MRATRNRKPSTQLEALARRQDGRRLLGPLEASVTSAAAAAASALALAQAHASRHSAAGADPVNLLNLAGFPGGTANFLRADGSFAAPTPAPGGLTTQVQFNDAGALNGDAGLTYDKLTDTLALAGLLDLSGAAAGQIKFPASQNPSSNSNTLDDYERGTWLPFFTSSVGGTGGATYSGQGGMYIKIGRLVFVTGTCTQSNRGTMSGSMYLGGLPFTVEGAIHFPGGNAAYFSGLTTSVSGFPTLFIEAATTRGAIHYVPAGGAGNHSHLQATDVSAATFDFRFGTFYLAAS